MFVTSTGEMLVPSAADGIFMLLYRAKGLTDLSPRKAGVLG
jgi:hypothetical protein